jgi:hypothetical protein
MMKAILSWVVIAGCLMVLAWGVMDRLNYRWEEKTYGPRFRTVTLCKYLDRELLLLASDGAMPPPEKCMEELVKRQRVSSSAITDAWGHAFVVRVASNGDARVWSSGPDGVLPSPDDLNADSSATRPHAHGGFFSGM